MREARIMMRGGERGGSRREGETGVYQGGKDREERIMEERREGRLREKKEGSIGGKENRGLRIGEEGIGRIIRN